MRIYLTALLLTFSTLLFSCKKKPCGDIPDVYEYTYPEDMAKVPYTSHSEITFINTSTKDTIIFKSKNIDSGFWYYKDYSNECAGGHYLQNWNNQFTSPSYKYPLNVNLIFIGPGSSYLQVDLVANTFYLWPGGLRKPFFDFDSIQIGNKIYYDVKHFKNEIHPENNTLYGCYYNIEYGILEIDLPEGKLQLVKLIK